jgi:hypothetical protein
MHGLVLHGIGRSLRPGLGGGFSAHAPALLLIMLSAGPVGINVWRRYYRNNPKVGDHSEPPKRPKLTPRSPKLAGSSMVCFWQPSLSRALL